MNTISRVQLKGDERVLLVDDEKPILNMLGQMLTRYGYVVEAHHKSTKALENFQRTPYEFDLIITDMTMPGYTGGDLMKKIKDIRPEIPIILCTGFSENIANEKVKGVKPNKILVKPTENDVLLKSIRCLLD